MSSEGEREPGVSVGCVVDFSGDSLLRLLVLRGVTQLEFEVVIWREREEGVEGAVLAEGELEVGNDCWF